jgi:hypothetical protein
VTAGRRMNVNQARRGAERCARNLAGRGIEERRQLALACRVISSSKDPEKLAYARVLLWLRVSVLGDAAQGKSSIAKLVNTQRLVPKLTQILSGLSKAREPLPGALQRKYARALEDLGYLAASSGVIDHPPPVTVWEWRESRAELERRLLAAGIHEVYVSSIFSDDFSLRALRKRVKAATKRRESGRWRRRHNPS